jgi:hypothetical protein
MREDDDLARDPPLPQGSFIYYMDMREEEEAAVAKDRPLTKTGPAAVDVFPPP